MQGTLAVSLFQIFEWAISRKNDKAKRATELGRKTNEETEKWNQMTVLRFQTGGGVGVRGGWNQTSPARSPFSAEREEKGEGRREEKEEEEEDVWE